MQKHYKYTFHILSIILIITSCGEPTESMDEFIKRTCDKESYDCDCYSKKVKSYFKSEDKFAEWKESNEEGYPQKLIDLKGECSNDEWDF